MDIMSGVSGKYLYGFYRRENADLGPIKSMTQQIIDCCLHLLFAVEHADGFPDFDGVGFFHHINPQSISVRRK